MLEYKVTVVEFGRDRSSPGTVAKACETHLNEMAAEGWRLVHADRNPVAVPGCWFYTWERGWDLSGLSGTGLSNG